MLLLLDHQRPLCSNVIQAGTLQEVSCSKVSPLLKATSLDKHKKVCRCCSICLCLLSLTKSLTCFLVSNTVPVSSLQFDQHKCVMSMGQSCVILNHATGRQGTLHTSTTTLDGCQLQLVYCQNYLLTYEDYHMYCSHSCWRSSSPALIFTLWAHIMYTQS
jgi:hypothetical protein